MEKISVVVPIYNVKNWLERCLDSIISQTYKNLEIILVNDGSTDQSVNICKEYLEKDSRIKLYNKPNGGLSDARNYGIEKSTGEYITFIDSDDFIEDRFLEVLYNGLKKHSADISIVNYYNFFEETSEFVYYTLKEDYYEEVFTAKEALNDYYSLKNNRYTSFVVACMKLYKKELFNNIRFPVGRYCEDDFTTYKLFMKSNKIVFLNDSLYCYRIRGGSLSGESFSKQRVLDYKYAHEERISFLAASGFDTKPHIQPYFNKLEFVANKFLEMGEIVEYEKVNRELEFLKELY